MKILKSLVVALLFTTSLCANAQFANVGGSKTGAISDIDVKYQGEIAVAGLFGGETGLAVQTVHGAKFGKYVFLGAGLQADVSTSDFSLWTLSPFASIKGYYPINEDINVFLGPNLGVSVDLFDTYGSKTHFMYQVLAGLERDKFQVGLGVADYSGEAAFMVKLGVVF